MYVPTCSSIAPRSVHRSPAIGCALEQRTAQSIIYSLSETTMRFIIHIAWHYKVNVKSRA